MVTGTIARLVTDKGFGFIKASDGSTEYFFHLSSLQGLPFEMLQEGQRVDFEVEVGSVRGPRAKSVTVAAAD